MAEAKKWIKSSGIEKGGLHRSLGIPQGQKIPRPKIEEAMRSNNPRIRKQASLAETFAKMRG